MFAEKKTWDKLRMFYTNLKKVRVDQAGPSQEPDHEADNGSKVYEFIDSDNEICGWDDDLMEDAIHLEAKQVKGNKKAKGS